MRPVPSPREGMAFAEPDLLWNAVSEAIAPVAHLEHEWEPNKFEKKIRDYFKKAVKAVEFGRKPWDVLVNDYADAVFSNIFNAVGEREWLHQVDFLLVLDAAIKEGFPARLLSAVPQEVFERTVLGAHDRAFEEQRYLPILWEVVQGLVTGDKSRKKVYNAGEEGRKQAALANGASTDNVKTFVSRWVDLTIARLSKDTQGEPEWILPEATAVQLFHTLVESGGLPVAYTAEEAQGPPPRGWPFIDYAVNMAYVKYCTGAAEQEAWAAMTKKGKKKRKAAGGMNLGTEECFSVPMAHPAMVGGTTADDAGAYIFGAGAYASAFDDGTFVGEQEFLAAPATAKRRRGARLELASASESETPPLPPLGPPPPRGVDAAGARLRLRGRALALRLSGRRPAL